METQGDITGDITQEFGLFARLPRNVAPALRSGTPLRNSK